VGLSVYTNPINHCQETGLSTQEDTMLTEAIAAVRAGDQTRARDLLSRLLKMDSANPEYWLWMSSVVETDRERIYCLQSVLRNDPTNRAALRGLTILGDHIPETAEISAALKIPHRKMTPPSRVSPTSLPVKNAWQILAGIAGILIVIVVIASVLFRPRATGVAPTLAPLTPTFTPAPPTATQTPVPLDSVLSRTPIPQELSGTPLASLLSFTPTATPLVGITPRPIYEAYTSAVNALERGDFSGSIQYIGQVIDLDPNLADAYYLLGEAYRLLGKLPEAESAYQQALDRNPLMAAAYLGMAQIQLQRNPSTLPENINLAISYDPSLVPAYLIKCEILSRNQNWEALADTVQSALNAGGNTPILNIYLGEAQFHLGMYEQALENLLRGSANDPSIFKAYFLLGRDLIELGRYDQAISPLKTHLAYQPNDPVAWSYLGYVHYLLQDYANSEQAFDQAITLNPQDQLAYRLRGLIRLQQKRFDEALGDLLKVQSFGDTSDEFKIMIAEANYGIGNFSDTLAITRSLIDTSADSKVLLEAYTLEILILEIQDPPLMEETLARWQLILDLEGLPEVVRIRARDEIAKIESIFITPTPTPVPIEP
jgi:tetratricopeptide (TPR) repeat protein